MDIDETDSQEPTQQKEKLFKRNIFKTAVIVAIIFDVLVVVFFLLLSTIPVPGTDIPLAPASHCTPRFSLFSRYFLASTIAFYNRGNLVLSHNSIFVFRQK